MIIKETDAEIQYQVSIYLVPTEYMLNLSPTKFFSKILTKSLDCVLTRTFIFIVDSCMTNEYNQSIKSLV